MSQFSLGSKSLSGDRPPSSGKAAFIDRSVRLSYAYVWSSNRKLAFCFYSISVFVLSNNSQLSNTFSFYLFTDSLVSLTLKHTRPNFTWSPTSMIFPYGWSYTDLSTVQDISCPLIMRSSPFMGTP